MQIKLYVSMEVVNYPSPLLNTQKKSIFGQKAPELNPEYLTHIPIGRHCNKRQMRAKNADNKRSYCIITRFQMLQRHEHFYNLTSRIEFY